MTYKASTQYGFSFYFLEFWERKSELFQPTVSFQQEEEVYVLLRKQQPEGFQAGLIALITASFS